MNGVGVFDGILAGIEKEVMNHWMGTESDTMNSLVGAKLSG